ncbi:hypothetical protein SAMN02983003_3462 [Devosia enhydra]|uniref:Uncharacterized protein n=1 Tax=Devosia enhydra TaxID=665118 RepID=A0A1K2I1L4_9HYPH|nr:hypothetical protein [Devosia enhydra]SFZ86282.1 hypothetical protein SAMN02983003_3462 [Devosia enhydra]
MAEPALVIDAAPSALFLPRDAGISRRPRLDKRPRPADFLDAFEAHALYYDIFWHADGRRVLMVGPPPVNLKGLYKGARFTALPSGRALKARRYRSLSVMTTALMDVPPDTTAIAVSMAGMEMQAPPGRSLVPAFAGRRILFTMNKDNDLDWIRFWAAHHAGQHGTDAVVVFDNGSRRYGTENIAETLASVPGVQVVATPSWPWAFGRTDPAVSVDPYWAHFLQIASMGVLLRRFGAKAEAILNCDIDELAYAPDGASIYALARGTSHGLLAMKGQWVEPVPEPGTEPRDHADFPFRLRNAKARFCRAGKWAIEPTRPWLQRLGVHPYWHWIEGRPLLAKRYAGGAFFWHFRGINTGWKEDRTGSEPDFSGLERDPVLAATLPEVTSMRRPAKAASPA